MRKPRQFTAPRYIPRIPEDEVFARVLSAIKTIKAMPDAERRFLMAGTKSGWVQTLVEWADLVAQAEQPKDDVEPREVYRDWLTSMNSNLKNYPDGTLAKAAEIIIATRKYRNFPLVSECLDACAEAQKWINSNKEQLSLIKSPDSFPEWHPDRERLAMELILGPMGKRAARENWIGMLFTFARKNMRLPQTDAEINHLIRESRLADKDYEKLLRNEYDIHPAKTLEWARLRGEFIGGWEDRFAKRERLARYVETGVLP